MRIPPRVGSTPARRSDLERLEGLARVWEELLPIPLVGRRIGLDALVGLVPGIGDVASALVAAWALVVGARLRAPGSVMGRMLLNIVIDTVVGSIPLLGDIFDIGWRAQRRNLVLLERWIDHPAGVQRRSTGLLLGLAAVLVATVVGALWLAFTALTLLFRLG